MFYNNSLMKRKVFTYLHSHWDREWYKSFERFRHRLIEVLDDVFQKLDRNEINSFYLDGQTAAILDYLEIHPEKIEYVKELIKEHKLFIGPFYVLADEFLVSGISLVKNLYYGLYDAKNLSEDYFIGYLPDAFGHNSMMVDILNLAGIKNALLWRGVDIKDNVFIWKNNNNELLTSFLPLGYYQDYFTRRFSYKNLSELIKLSLDKLSKFSKSAPMLLPVGADHLGTPDKIKNIFFGLNKYLENYEFELSSLEKYFADIKKVKVSISGELKSNKSACILPSVASSRMYLKQKNAFSQWNLSRKIEPFISVLGYFGYLKNYQNEFDYAWKLLLQNHAHDSIYGCSVDEAHAESLVRNLKVDELCDDIKVSAVFNLEQKIKKDKILIANLSNYNYSGVTKLLSYKKLPYQRISRYKHFPDSITGDIKNIPVQENYKYINEYLLPVKNIEGFSAKTYDLPKPSKSDIKISEKTIENSLIRIEVNKDGTINIKDKLSGKIFKNLHKIIDEGDFGDSYNFSPIINENPLKAELLSSKIIEKGISRACLRLKYKINIPKFAKNNHERSKTFSKTIITTDIYIYENSKRAEFKTSFINSSKDHRLKINFNLQKNIENIRLENAFGIVERNYNPQYDYKKFMPAKKGEELDLNTNSFQRFVSSQGLCILTKGLNEYEVFGKELNITLLRSFGILAKKRLDTRGFAAGPPLETPEGQMLGKFEAEYALLISDDENEMFKNADFYYNPIICFEGKAKTDTFKDIKFLNLPEVLQIHSVSHSLRNQSLLVCIFNSSNKEVVAKLDLKGKNIFEINLLEEKISGENLKNKTVKFEPHSLKLFSFAY